MAEQKWQLIAKDAVLLPPFNDRIFKVLMTHPDAKQILMDIISAVIGQKVTNVQIRNNEVAKKFIYQKNERFDINCTIDNKEQVNVEMHCFEREEVGIKRTNFINKYTYYTADLHSTQKTKGKAYIEFVRTYQITFSTHSIFPNRKDFVSRFSLRTEDGEQFTDQINLIIIELDKLNEALKKPVEQLTSFEKWSLFLKFASDPVHRRKINDIIKGKEEINMASALLQEISKDEKEVAIFRSRRMAETDRISDLRTVEIRVEQKYKSTIADKDAKLADKDAKLADKDAKLADKDAKLADKDAKLADNEKLIEQLRLQLSQFQENK